jgi:hypothetical protein
VGQELERKRETKADLRSHRRREFQGLGRVKKRSWGSVSDKNYAQKGLQQKHFLAAEKNRGFGTAKVLLSISQR